MYFTDEYLSRRKREAALELEPSATTNLRRVAISPRDSSFKKRFAEFGFTFHDMPGVSYNKGTVLSSAASSLPRPLRDVMVGFERVTEPYWHESAAYEVTPEGMSSVEEASHEIHSMCLEAVDEIVNDGHLLTQFGIPRELHAAVKHSWSTRQCDLVGRLDFLWDGEGAPKCEHPASHQRRAPTTEASDRRRLLGPGSLKLLLCGRSGQNLGLEGARAKRARRRRCWCCCSYVAGAGRISGCRGETPEPPLRPARSHSFGDRSGWPKTLHLF
jgi:hypothetical protein